MRTTRAQPAGRLAGALALALLLAIAPVGVGRAADDGQTDAQSRGNPTAKTAPPPPALRTVRGEEFVPFKHIAGIEPGWTTQSQVVEMLGQPEETEVTKVEDVAGIKVGGNKILKYPSRGLFLIIGKDDLEQRDPVVNGIFAEAPFRGSSPSGLTLGMPRADVLRICNRDYFLTTNLGDSVFFATERNGDSRLQLWFTDDKLSRAKIYAPLKKKD